MQLEPTQADVLRNLRVDRELGMLWGIAGLGPGIL